MAERYAQVPSDRSGRWWFVDVEKSWIYHSYNAGYRCRHYRTCPVRLRRINGFWCTDQVHTLANEYVDICNAKLVNEMKTVVAMRPGDMHEIFTEIRNRSHPDATVTYVSIYSTLQSIRRRTEPPVPESMHALAQVLLDNPFYRSDFNTNLFVCVRVTTI